MRMSTCMILTALIAAPYAAQALDIGDSIVDTGVKMKNVDGSMVTIDDAGGEKGTLVIFTCNHCPFVKGWQDTMVRLSNDAQADGIGVIYINANDPAVAGDTFEKMQELSEEKGYTFPYVVDATSDVARHFDAKKTPDVFLFDADGKLIYKGAVGEGGRGPKPGGKLYLKEALDALRQGTPVKTAETKAIGCSIKFR